MRMAEAMTIGVQLGRRSARAVSARELVDVGVDLRAVSRLVKAGDVTALWRGMYAFGPVSDLTRAHAAIKHAKQRVPDGKPQPAPVVTGLLALRALELPWVPHSTHVQVLVGRDVHRPSYEQITVRRCWDITTVDTWSLDGARIADSTRAAYDGARECESLRDVRGVILGAVNDGVTTQHLTRLLDEGAVGGTRWTRRAVLDASRGCASPPEAEAVDAMIGCGWPFYVNPDLYLGGQFLCRPDVFLVGTGSGGELDSVQEHNASQEKLVHTLNRHTTAARVIDLLHRTPGQLRADPPAFVRALIAQAEDRLARGLGDPQGLEIRPRGPLLR
ncbi:MAG: hypothetical protein ABR549_19585 [Mycobacteriales bacterium]